MNPEPTVSDQVQDGHADEKKGASLVQMLAWFGVGVAVAAAGLFVGREIRSRYKFNRRTPYDFYANAGEYQAGEFGVGI